MAHWTQCQQTALLHCMILDHPQGVPTMTRYRRIKFGHRSSLASSEQPRHIPTCLEGCLAATPGVHTASVAGHVVMAGHPAPLLYIISTKHSHGCDSAEAVLLTTSRKSQLRYYSSAHLHGDCHCAVRLHDQSQASRRFNRITAQCCRGGTLRRE